VTNGLKNLRIFSEGHPRAYFFRMSETLASDKDISYEEWERTFERLMGIQGKVLEEELPGLSERNIEFFNRFKQRHPDQLVLLHFNGASGDPRFGGDDFFAGHWLYFEGTEVLSDVSADCGETDILVADPTIFRTRIGRRGDQTDEIGLCVLDAEGRPNWRQSEQVKLLSVDEETGLIRVQRGYVGTRPRAFQGGKACVAPHVTRGPCGQFSNLMWNYNLSTRCPRGAKGRSCADALLERLTQLFTNGGELAAFDGLEFDAIYHDLALKADYDGSGRASDGVFDGVNTYGIGLLEFCRRLRDALGEQKLIIGDFNNPTFQRAFGIFNGIESEGWPGAEDSEVRRWSEGLNRHWFWAQNARAPAFSYFNHRFMCNDAAGKRTPTEVPFNIHRLVLAAAMFTGSGVCYSAAPENQPNERIGIWDELKMGLDNRIGWLGQPVGPARRLALEQPDLLQGRGNPISGELASHFVAPHASVNIEKSGLKIGPADSSDSNLRFALREVPCDGPDLFISLTAHGQPQRGYPNGVARCMRVGLAPLEGQLVTRSAPAAGLRLRGRAETDLTHDSGAIVRYAERVQMNGQVRPAYAVHPPTKPGAGYTFWEREARVPQGGRLEFFTGMGPKTVGVSDGVTFRVLVSESSSRGAEAPAKLLFEHSQTEPRWIRHCVSLAPWSGKTIGLKFISDCGPNDDSAGDLSYWGDAWVLDPEIPASPNAHGVRFTTWVGETHFTSGFYFSDVCASQVDVEFEVEGPEPIWISSLTAHAHPDALLREFERGAVVANPSLHEYTFDLEQLLPGRAFRRLKASSRQDTKTNDGSPISGKLALGERDALFLVNTSATLC